jgi:hypothetical protein
MTQGDFFIVLTLDVKVGHSIDALESRIASAGACAIAFQGLDISADNFQRSTDTQLQVDVNLDVLVPHQFRRLAMCLADIAVVSIGYTGEVYIYNELIRVEGECDFDEVGGWDHHQRTIEND